MKKIILLIVTSFLFIGVTAQDQGLPGKIIRTAMSSINADQIESPRKILKPRTLISRLNPFYYIGAGLMYLYQNTISEQVQADCMYETSCSEFTKLSIERYGFIGGSLRGFNQMTECNNGAIYEHSRLYISSRKKIINCVEDPGE